jgi:hypothetical protein
VRHSSPTVPSAFHTAAGIRVSQPSIFAENSLQCKPGTPGFLLLDAPNFRHARPTARRQPSVRIGEVQHLDRKVEQSDVHRSKILWPLLPGAREQVLQPKRLRLRAAQSPLLQ